MKLDELFSVQLDEGRYDPFIFKAIFICGAPGSGKTTIENKMNFQSLGLKNLNLDRIIHYLKKNQRPSNNRAEKMAETSFGIYLNEKLGVVIETTGRKEADIIKMNNLLLKQNYQTMMLFISAEKELARMNIEQRPQNSKNPHDIGRIVDPDYFEEAYAATQKNRDFYEHLFGDDFVLIKNVDGVLESTSFEVARKKVNSFLHAPLTSDAAVYVKGVKHPSLPVIGRAISRPTS